jgi:hypothetical protein
VTASTVKGISDVMAAQGHGEGFHMPMTNVLVGTRTGPPGSGRKVVPLVTGMKAYPVHAGPKPPQPGPRAAVRIMRQTNLIDGQWTALRPE